MLFIIVLSLFAKTEAKEYPYLIPYLKGDKWGFCDIDKNIVIEPMYDDAYLIKNERGWAKKEDKYALIDLENGKPLTDFEFDDIDNWVEYGFIEVRKGTKYTLIDFKNGKPLTDLEFDGITPLILILDAPSFPYYRVHKDSLKGVIDTLGNIIVPIEYDDVNASFKFKEKFYVGEKDEKMWLISSKGKALNKRGYDKIFPHWDSNFVEVEMNGKVGYIDNKGKEITPFIYGREFVIVDGKQLYYPPSNVVSSEKYREVKVKEKSGVINRKGETVIPCIYDDISSFAKNVFIAKRDGKIGGVNTNNQIVIPFEYDKSSFEFKFEKDKEEDSEMHLFVLEKNGKTHYLDTTLKEVPFSDYDDIDYLDGYRYYYGKDAFIVKKNGKFGIIDIKDSIIIPVEYDRIFDCDGFMEFCSFRVEKEKQYGFINPRNWQITSPKYD